LIAIRYGVDVKFVIEEDHSPRNLERIHRCKTIPKAVLFYLADLRHHFKLRWWQNKT